MDQNHAAGLFENYKVCSHCGRRLPDDYEEEFCPRCKDIMLLHDVKDFIREHDVNEYQVAEHFHIPVRMVKGWIREGHIEYRTNRAATFTIHCQHCGAPVTFGSVCPKCLKLLNGTGKGYGLSSGASTDERMRFLENRD
jgi:RNA polymerase subunit RPABC4/transcription elongation factor Spt4